MKSREFHYSCTDKVPATPGSKGTVLQRSDTPVLAPATQATLAQV